MKKMSTRELVSDIKSRYGQLHRNKLAIQRDMVALRDQHGWTQQQIAEATGIPRATVKDWLLAYDEQISEGLGDVTRLTPKSHHRASDLAVSRRVLSTASEEELERIVEKLPAERRRVLAATAGNAYHREALKEREPVSEREQRERDNAARKLTRPVAQAAAGFASLGIVGHIEQATDELNELVADGSLTPKLIRQIDRVTERWLAVLDTARALAGGE